MKSTSFHSGLILVALLAMTVPASAQTVTLNEIRIDQTGADNDECFELAGAPGASLAGLTYLVIGDGTGGSGVIEAVVSLAGQAIAADGLFLVAESTLTLGAPDLIASLNFENSDNVTHLLVSEFTGANGQDLDTNDDGTLDVTPWTSIVDLVALVEEQNPPSSTVFHYGPPSVGPDGDFVPGHVYRCPDANGEWQIGPFDPAAGDDTPGEANDCEDVPPPLGACGDPATAIHDVQGAGAASAMVGELREIEGVVVGDFQSMSTGLRGFFVQEEDGEADSDATTSEGIFVFDDGFGVDVAPGDVVRVAGTVTEFNGLTEITAVASVAICASGASATPATITFPLGEPTELEAAEGMAVTVPDTLTVSEVFNLGRFGEVLLSGGDRLFIPTQLAPPGAPALAVTEANRRNRIVLDDGSNVQNPDPMPHLFGPEPTLRVGDQVSGLTGVLSFGFSAYRIQPTEAPAFVRANPRTEAPAPVGGSLRVASFNVLNFFNGEPKGTFPTERGADTPTELARQREKIVAAIGGLGADVVGLIEIENDGFGPESAIAELVDALNAADGGKPQWRFVDAGGPIGTDAITVGFIYRKDKVALAEAPAITSAPPFDMRRPPLAQTFVQKGRGGRVTVVINHFKSKGCADATVGDLDQGDGQACYNAERVAAANTLIDWLAGDPTGSGDDDFLILGDLNAYAMEDPIRTLATAGYESQIERFEGLESTSFVFFGESGALDHALANPSLASQISGATHWKINGDEPIVLDYNEEFKTPAQEALNVGTPYRSSDHDPVVVGLDLRPGRSGRR